MAKVEQVVESSDSKMTVAQSVPKPSQKTKVDMVEKNLDEKNGSADSGSISSGDKIIVIWTFQRFCVVKLISLSKKDAM